MTDKKNTSFHQRSGDLSEPVPLSKQRWGEKTTPLLVTSTLTFNHVDYIESCLKGILMQKTTFPVHIVIFDDCSTDGTREIIMEYEAKYPKLITGIYPKENTYKKPGRKAALEPRNKAREKGKYIALCEGDDYWTDPLKLQKQVEFLEEHPDFMVTSSGYIKKYRDFEEEVIKANDPSFINETDQGFEFDLFSKGWLTKTLTSVFRNDQSVLGNFTVYKYARDVHLFYHLLKSGKGYYFKEIFGVYNIHKGGIFSTIPQLKKDTDHYFIFRELYEINKDEFSRHKYFRYLMKYIAHLSTGKIEQGDKSLSALKKEAWSIHKGPRERKIALKAIVPQSLKNLYHKIFS